MVERFPDSRLAIRSGSMALVKAIIEKLGISRNRMVSLATSAAGVTIAHRLGPGTLGLAFLPDCDILTVAQRRGDSICLAEWRGARDARSAAVAESPAPRRLGASSRAVSG